MMQAFLRCLLLSSTAFVFSALADDESIFPVVFPKIEINGRPASMVLDTALPGTGFVDPLAKHLRLNEQGAWVDNEGWAFRISELTQVADAGETFMAPLLIVRLPWWARLISHLLTIHVDGVVGWPEIRDNILVFDSTQRTIRGVEQLPPETRDWMKLKVVPDDCLLLELPLADGQSGILCVDTLQGGHTAIVMSPAPWKEWRAAHPYGSHADQISLGALNLSNVAVKEMSARDANYLLDEVPSTRSIWKLGMAALTRLDLVVDGKNGWAYLNPKPPQTKTGRRVEDGNWKVAANVRLGTDNLFVYSGIYKWYRNDLPGAEADYNHALELNPRNADAYSGRGQVREVLGDFSNAVSNYDKVIELRPITSDWERLYRQTLLWRFEGPTQEVAKPAGEEKKSSQSAIELNTVVVQGARPRHKERWVKTISLFLRGVLDEKELLAAAKRNDGGETVPEQKAQADYYIGMTRLSQNDKAGAGEWLKKCRAAGVKKDNEYYFAVAELARLGGAK